MELLSYVFVVCILHFQRSEGYEAGTDLYREENRDNAAPAFEQLKIGVYSKGTSVRPSIQPKSYPAKFVPPRGIPVPVTPFPFKLLSPRVVPVNRPVPPELQKIMNPLPIIPMPRPLPTSLAAAVRVSCTPNKMHVWVRTDMYGFRCKSGQLTLGTRCRSNGVSGAYLLFTYDLKECGSKESMEDGQLVYKNVLHYVPSAQNGTIRRSMPFTVPIECHYYRYHHVYRHGIRPLWRNRAHFKNLKTSYGFALRTVNGSVSSDALLVLGKRGGHDAPIQHSGETYDEAKVPEHSDDTENDEGAVEADGDGR
ncbi:UNVERIFIED_CONTAM: hypothetical protein FKN15_078388 [Acipenser sinensis]